MGGVVGGVKSPGVMVPAAAAVFFSLNPGGYRGLAPKLEAKPISRSERLDT